MVTIKVEIEEELAALLSKINPNLAAAVREIIVLEFYRRGMISSRNASRALGMEDGAFIQYASSLGI